ncbi:MAG: alpha-amylase family glycosyl hydrolase, partial [Nocardioidaceae bacterium]
SYPDRVMVGEVFLSRLERVARYVGKDRLHQAFNFPLLAAPLDAATWRRVVTEALAAFEGEGTSPTWVLSNHDVVRHATRYGGGDAGRGRARGATLALLGLPGSPYLFEGEELGLEQDDVPPQARQDPIWLRSGGAVEGRDGARTPVPWTREAPGHGFTTGTPWLPFGPHAGERSVEAQEADPGSTLAFYRRALAVRRDLRGGLDREVRWLDVPEGVLGYERAHRDGGSLQVLLNTGARDVAVEMPPGELLVASHDAVPGTLQPGAALWWRR